MLEQAPHKRWTPRQAAAHPFLAATASDHNDALSWRPPRDARADERRHFFNFAGRGQAGVGPGRGYDGGSNTAWVK